MLSFNGFLLIPSIIYITTFPPSNGGNGNRFVTPNDNDISAKIYLYKNIYFHWNSIYSQPGGRK